MLKSQIWLKIPVSCKYSLNRDMYFSRTLCHSQLKLEDESFKYALSNTPCSSFSLEDLIQISSVFSNYLEILSYLLFHRLAYAIISIYSSSSNEQKILILCKGDAMD